MMFLGIFRNDLQKIVREGSKFGPPGPKKQPFLQFLDLKIFPVHEFFLIFLYGVFERVYKSFAKIAKKGSKFYLVKQQQPAIKLFQFCLP